MNALVKTYQNNLAKSKQLSNTLYTLEEKRIKSTNKVTWSYRERIHKLEEELSKEVTKLNDEYRKKETAINEEQVKLRQVPNDVERIIACLMVKPEPVVSNETDITNPRGTVEHLGLIYSDDYLKIRAFIISNRKPVNKFSLCLYGVGLFGKDLIDYPYSYGLPGNSDEHQDIAMYLGSFPIHKSLLEFYEKHNTPETWVKPLKEFIDQFKAVEKEYLKVISTYKLQDFKDLFVMECKCCGFVLTPISKKGYSLRDGKCPNCNISLKEASKIASTPNNKLPLYLGDKWETEEAEEFYRRRMMNLKKVA
jgi:hypothetical protein